MGASITNAGKEEWTYFDTFSTSTTEHDLPINWKTLYIHVTKSGFSDTILILKDALPSGTSHYVNGTRDTSLVINASTNKITVSNGTAKVYYR